MYLIRKQICGSHKMHRDDVSLQKCKYRLAKSSNNGDKILRSIPSVKYGRSGFRQQICFLALINTIPLQLSHHNLNEYINVTMTIRLAHQTSVILPYLNKNYYNIIFWISCYRQRGRHSRRRGVTKRLSGARQQRHLVIN